MRYPLSFNARQGGRSSAKPPDISACVYLGGDCFEGGARRVLAAAGEETVIRVGLFSDSDVFAGTERHMLDLGCGLKRAGCEVVVIAPGAGELARRARGEGIEVVAVPKRGRLDWRAAWTLRRMLAGGKLDLIHAHNGRTSLIGAMAVGCGGRGKLICTQHFIRPSRLGRGGIKGLVSRLAHRWVERRTARIIAISAAVRDAMLSRGDAPAGKIVVVHNGIQDICDLQFAICDLNAMGVASCQLPVASEELSVASCELLVASEELRVAGCQLPVANPLRIADCGSRIENQKSSIRNPQFPSPSLPLPPSPRLPLSASPSPPSVPSPQHSALSPSPQSSPLTIVCAARLEPEKDVAVLVEAMAIVAKRCPESQCLIAGEGSLRDALTARIGGLGLEANVRLLGFRRDVHAVIGGGDVFVLPSAAEPFGLVLLEAMALGKPVVATAAGGPLEIVAHGRSGLLVPPSDPAALAGAILALASDPALRSAMGQAGRRRFIAHFTADRMAEQMMGVYRLVLSAEC